MNFALYDRGARRWGASARTFQLRNPRRHEESDLQRAVVRYWALQYPKTWALTVHYPSGMAAGSAKHAAIFVGLGMKKGVPDLLCFARRGEYAGLAIELKRDRKQKLNTDQRAWLERLDGEGWRVGAFHDLAVIGDFIDQYHALARPARGDGDGLLP